MESSKYLYYELTGQYSCGCRDSPQGHRFKTWLVVATDIPTDPNEARLALSIGESNTAADGMASAEACVVCSNTSVAKGMTMTMPATLEPPPHLAPLVGRIVGFRRLVGFDERVNRARALAGLGGPPRR